MDSFFLLRSSRAATRSGSSPRSIFSTCTMVMMPTTRMVMMMVTLASLPGSSFSTRPARQSGPMFQGFVLAASSSKRAARMSSTLPLCRAAVSSASQSASQEATSASSPAESTERASSSPRSASGPGPIASSA